MILVDTHTHLYSEEFINDIDAVIKNAETLAVKRFYLPAIDSGSHDTMLDLADKYEGICIPMMGLHPCYVNDFYKRELKIVEDFLAKRKFCAIGEIGLDFYWDKTFITQQYDAFNFQMELALQHQLPIVIHTRNAMQETIDAVKPFAAKGLKGIFHCFGGTIEDANAIIDMNFLLGIGGIVTYKNSTLPQVLEKISLEHIVLETDAPYLPPVPYRGKRNESGYLRYVAEKLATIKQTTLEEVAAITTANAEKIFK